MFGTMGEGHAMGRKGKKKEKFKKKSPRKRKGQSTFQANQPKSVMPHHALRWVVPSTTEIGGIHDGY